MCVLYSVVRAIDTLHSDAAHYNRSSLLHTATWHILSTQRSRALSQCSERWLYRSWSVLVLAIISSILLDNYLRNAGTDENCLQVTTSTDQVIHACIPRREQMIQGQGRPVYYRQGALLICHGTASDIDTRRYGITELCAHLATDRKSDVVGVNQSKFMQTRRS